MSACPGCLSLGTGIASNFSKQIKHHALLVHQEFVVLCPLSRLISTFASKLLLLYGYSYHICLLPRPRKKLNDGVKQNKKGNITITKCHAKPTPHPNIPPSLLFSRGKLCSSYPVTTCTGRWIENSNTPRDPGLEAEGKLVAFPLARSAEARTTPTTSYTYGGNAGMICLGEVEKVPMM